MKTKSHFFGILHLWLSACIILIKTETYIYVEIMGCIITTKMNYFFLGSNVKRWTVAEKLEYMRMRGSPDTADLHTSELQSNGDQINTTGKRDNVKVNRFLDELKRIIRKWSKTKIYEFRSWEPNIWWQSFFSYTNDLFFLSC